MRVLEAVLILSGMIIGVGMFGIPFSFARAGFWLGTAELVILTGVVLVLHLLYGEIVTHTPAHHRLPGYVKTYLGRGFALLSWGSVFFGVVGTLLAYIIIDGVFLRNIFQHVASGISEFWWALFSTALVAGITVFPLKREALINGILTVFEIGFFLALIVFLFPRFNPAHIGGFDLGEVALPYGILLFALSGAVVIPDIVAILGSQGRARSRFAITLGTVIPAVIYFLFALVVVGTTGIGVSEETIRGLKPILGEGIVVAGSIAGFLAVFTSFITLSSSFQQLLRLDFGLSSMKWAWAAGSIVPFLFYLAGFQNFIVIIGVVGAIAIGIDAALIIAAYHRMRTIEGHARSSFSFLWEFLIYAMVAVGIIWELSRFLGG